MAERILDAGLSIAHVGLNALAWEESSRSTLDGVIPRARVQRLPGWSRRREADLIEAAIWRQSVMGEVELIDYLDYNRSRDQIEALREKRQRAGRDGGKARAESPSRDPDTGQFGTHNYTAVGDDYYDSMARSPLRSIDQLDAESAARRAAVEKLRANR